MKYISVADIAEKWHISERMVRNYAKNNRIDNARLNGNAWEIPEDAEKPGRVNKRVSKPTTLLERLKEEKNGQKKGSIYHKIQIELTYNSNHIEGSTLTREQTRYIYETNTIGLNDSVVNVDDIVETANHFRCVDLIVEQANYKLSENLIKELHKTLKNGTSDSRKNWFAVGGYKRLPNEVGGRETVLPEQVSEAMKELLRAYNGKTNKTFADIIEFHYQFESIHPFQDGNGRVGRLILFKECLNNNLTPFIIEEDLKLFYYRGLKEWIDEKEYLLDTCYTAQDRFKKALDYFRIDYFD
ncbi:hypothetical protein IGI37_000471 [Enterococcus sp. AZ194]|uniref:Fic family protein n=1 Tax=Enterococcus sp. AZ194 TaxID=2774629 RepID=UPI003F1FC060